MLPGLAYQTDADEAWAVDFLATPLMINTSAVLLTTKKCISCSAALQRGSPWNTKEMLEKQSQYCWRPWALMWQNTIICSERPRVYSGLALLLVHADEPGAVSNVCGWALLWMQSNCFVPQQKMVLPLVAGSWESAGERCMHVLVNLYHSQSPPFYVTMRIRAYISAL